MKNRLEVAKKLLTNDGCLIVAIDENEQAELKVLLKEIFRNYEIHVITIVHNPEGAQGTNFYYTHEYAIFVIPKGKKVINKKKVDVIKWQDLMDTTGNNFLRENAKNCFYPVIIENQNIRRVGEVESES